MPFAIAMTLVVLISSLLLIYQFSTREFADDDAEGVADAPAPFPVERPTFSGVERPAFNAHSRIDTAA